MASRRIERINELLRAEISELITREIKDPRLSGMISVTEVDTSPDLRVAKVYISILGSEEERRIAINALQKAAGFFRKELGARLTLRRIPELSFRLDLSIERGDRIMRLLHEIEREDAKGEPGT
ncbi:MAG: 30S ribosome-binding factor RbfA [Chloroflexi bacterium]|nr:30S ribosome-binding factor RbfA [Chloroflexota bacterium]